MHHVIVTRVSVSLCALFAACILGFAALVHDPEPAVEDETDPATGRALFEQYCGRCHGVEELAEDLARAPDREVRMAELERFLESHGRASASEDRSILEYLARVGGGS